ncbi:P-loop containing nucleoside triphosphate hydrolase protein, partial [Mycena olivaceomarginata]
LPSNPKIFHGRESELKQVIDILGRDLPRVAILGGGGMGKTSLARAVLHHPDIPSKFEHKYFISVESATTVVELTALVGMQLGLKPGRDLTRAIVQFLSRGSQCLLVLDNMETPWESIESRSGVEEFLSLLTDIPHVALMITMRGAERPAKVPWTRPFLTPLEPLSDDAARQIFTDITGNSDDHTDITQLLSWTDNIPLAVDLLAHQVDYEGCANVLLRLATDKTAFLSAGNDRKSSLDASIRLSLSSPRLTSGARELLSLLSILPDGLSDVELLQSNLPIQNIRTCKAALMATSLVYSDNTKRLRALMPIREHLIQSSPPTKALTDPLRRYFYSLLDLLKRYRGDEKASIVTQVTLNLANLHQIL